MGNRSIRPKVIYGCLRQCRRVVLNVAICVWMNMLVWGWMNMFNMRHNERELWNCLLQVYMVINMCSLFLSIMCINLHMYTLYLKSNLGFAHELKSFHYLYIGFAWNGKCFTWEFNDNDVYKGTCRHICERFSNIKKPTKHISFRFVIFAI